LSWSMDQTNSDHGQENCGRRNRDFDKKIQYKWIDS
jgi:hypothetical protein